MADKLRIAHLSGPTATIQNTPPLVTSNKARARHGLRPLTGVDGAPLRYDALRPQRLAAPATVYVEQFSAHPLEADADHLYGPPDGYIGADGAFRRERREPGDKPVYEIELRPEDGLYPLPYMACQADGSAWEEECSAPGAEDENARQGFFPDGARSFEEIDRLSVDDAGHASVISARAEVDFYRGVPPGGYRKGLAAPLRSDIGEGHIPPERRGEHFYPYKPYHLASYPPRPMLAKATNDMQATAADGRYDGVIWTQGSPDLEDAAYWFNLLIDTARPICGNAAQRPQGQVGHDGPKNILDSIAYIESRIWADAEGRDRCGAVVIQEQQIFAARQVAKVDARPGGYAATGGHGGIIGQIHYTGRPVLTYLPVFRHTHLSDVALTRLPEAVPAVRRRDGRLARVPIAVKDAGGGLRAEAVPLVSIVKDGGFSGIEVGDDPALEADLAASIAHKLGLGLLAGFVVEGLVPYGHLPAEARNRAMVKASLCGLPVVQVGRGAPEGFADRHDLQIAGANLTGTKARLLLMACLLKFGSLPPAADPDNPTAEELAAIRAAIEAYQQVFDTH